MQIRSRIVGTGSYVPGKILKNSDFKKLVDTSDDWIIERTGIKERRVVESAEAASDLGFEASKRALHEAGIKPKELETVIVATMSGDMPMPSTASLIQGRLGAKNASAFDLNAACSGFLYGLSVADSLIRSRSSKKVLLIGVDVNSKFLDWRDRSTCVLFGDGAGAVVMKPTTTKRGVLSTHLHSDGKLWDLICLPGGGSRNPVSKESVRKKKHYIKMKGNETFRVAVRTLETLALNTLKANKIKPSQLSMLIPHQANLRIIKAIASRLKLPMNKVVVNLDKYGNTSSASIPIALDDAVRTGRVRKGDYILLEAFGSGLTWASALLRW